MGSYPAAYESEYDSFSTALPNYEIISFLCLKNQMLVVMGRIWDLENIESLLLTTLQNYGCDTFRGGRDQFSFYP